MAKIFILILKVKNSLKNNKNYSNFHEIFQITIIECSRTFKKIIF